MKQLNVKMPATGMITITEILIITAMLTSLSITMTSCLSANANRNGDAVIRVSQPILWKDVVYVNVYGGTEYALKEGVPNSNGNRGLPPQNSITNAMEIVDIISEPQRMCHDMNLIPMCGYLCTMVCQDKTNRVICTVDISRDGRTAVISVNQSGRLEIVAVGHSRAYALEMFRLLEKCAKPMLVRMKAELEALPIGTRSRKLLECYPYQELSSGSQLDN